MLFIVKLTSLTDKMSIYKPSEQHLYLLYLQLVLVGLQFADKSSELSVLNSLLSLSFLIAVKLKTSLLLCTRTSCCEESG